jgi:serine/threonine protein phosphatase PrpC
MITCDADISIIERQADQDDMLIIACDGIWDCVSNQICVKSLRRDMREAKSP